MIIAVGLTKVGGFGTLDGMNDQSAPGDQNPPVDANAPATPVVPPAENVNPIPVVNNEVSPTPPEMTPMESTVNPAMPSVGSETPVAPVTPAVPVTPVASDTSSTTPPAGHGQNKIWIVISVVVLIVVLGIFGAFMYISSMNRVEESSNLVATPTPEPAVEEVVVPREPTVDERVVALEGEISGLDGLLTAVDQGLADKQGDLSEN